MLSILWLFLPAFLTFAFFACGGSRWRRQRTDREDALHDDIQKAMNWSPDMAYKDKDGKYRNAYGQEFERLSLKEMLERHGIDKS